MKLVELLKNVKRILSDWSVFIILSCILHYLIFTGAVYQKPQIESGLTPIVKYFNDTAIMYGASPDYKNLVVKFVDKFPVKNWVGLCEGFNGHASKFISIHYAYFQNASVEQKYALVIHELGHCTLGKDHVEGYRKNGCPKSIMHPSDGLFGCFFKDQDYYFRELFGRL